eukprot:6201055-Pleurochrysis_carterae.AAC.1
MHSRLLLAHKLLHGSAQLSQLQLAAGSSHVVTTHGTSVTVRLVSRAEVRRHAYCMLDGVGGALELASRRFLPDNISVAGLLLCTAVK